MKRFSYLPWWTRVIVAVILLSILTNLPDVPPWLWYARRAAAFVIFLWAAYEIGLPWREFKRAQEKDEGEYYFIRLSWPMVAAIGFGLICVLLLVTQLLGAR